MGINCRYKIETELNYQWDLGSADGGFIGMNIGVSAIFRTVDKIIEHLKKNEDVEPELTSAEDLATKVIPFLIPVATS